MTRALDLKLTAYTGRDAIFTFTAEGIDPDTNEIAAIDLTGVAVTFVVENAAGTVQWTGTIGSGVTLTGEDGQYTVWIPKATTASLCPGPYSVGCELDDGVVSVQALAGTLTLRDGVA